MFLCVARTIFCFRTRIFEFLILSDACDIFSLDKYFLPIDQIFGLYNKMCMFSGEVFIIFF